MTSRKMRGGAVEPGGFDTRLRIERAEASESDTGAESKTWTTLASVWGSVRSDGGTETGKGGQAFDRSRAVVKIRAGGEGGKVHATDRIVRVSDGEVFEVRCVRPYPGNRPRWIEIDCYSRRDVSAAAP